MSKEEFKELTETHDGHGRISCRTRKELHKYFKTSLVNKIMNRLGDMEDDSKNPYDNGYGRKKFFEELTFKEFNEIVDGTRSENALNLMVMKRNRKLDQRF